MKKLTVFEYQVLFQRRLYCILFGHWWKELECKRIKNCIRTVKKCEICGIKNIDNFHLNMSGGHKDDWMALATIEALNR